MQTEANGGLARTGSGLIVPKELADQQEAAAAKTPGQRFPIARDMDGRRRVVFTNAERKVLDRAIVLLKARGIGFIAGCVGQLSGGHHSDGSKVCGQPMQVEGVGGPDAGMACNCTRVHFIRA